VILRRILFFLASATALAVSAGVVVVALAFALYALVKPYAGPAGASAVVAAAAAILIGLIGFVLGALATPRRRRGKLPESVIDRVVEFVRDKPVTSIAAAIAAGLMAVRNPRYLGEVIRSFVEGRQAPRR
jgi:hypothetical protein